VTKKQIRRIDREILRHKTEADALEKKTQEIEVAHHDWLETYAPGDVIPELTQRVEINRNKIKELRSMAGYLATSRRMKTNAHELIRVHKARIEELDKEIAGKQKSKCNAWLNIGRLKYLIRVMG